MERPPREEALNHRVSIICVWATQWQASFSQFVSEQPMTGFIFPISVWAANDSPHLPLSTPEELVRQIREFRAGSSRGRVHYYLSGCSFIHCPASPIPISRCWCLFHLCLWFCRGAGMKQEKLLLFVFPLCHWQEMLWIRVCITVSGHFSQHHGKQVEPSCWWGAVKRGLLGRPAGHGLDTPLWWLPLRPSRGRSLSRPHWMTVD